MNNRQKLLSTAVIMACSAISTQAQAVLAPNSILKFDAGAKACVLGGTPPSNCSYGVTSTTGSFFSMDADGNGSVADSERTLISPNAGVALNITQPASGSHSGAVDGTENPGLDNAWEYFGNTGMHQTTSAITSLSDNGAGIVTLDFSGWSVTWNGIADIPMGGDPANQATDNNIADVTCYTDNTKATQTDCLDGTFFVLDHLDVHVPLKDPSGFGNVAYTAHLEGTILVPQSPSPSSGTFAPGSIAATANLASAIDGRISMKDLVDSGTTTDADTDYSYSNGLFDFTITGLTNGASTQIVLALLAPIPTSPVYRKFNSTTGWTFFDTSGGDTIESGPGASGNCTGVTYTAGLTEGYYCVRLSITDGGSNDDDGTANGTIVDPGGVGSGVQPFVDSRTSGTDGCSMSGNSVNANQRADWWLVAGFMGLLGLFRLKRNQA